MKSRCLFSSWNRRFHSPLILPLGILCAAVCFTSALASAAASSQVAAPANRQKIRGHVPRVAAQLAPVGRLAAATPMKIAVGLPVRDQAGLSALLEQIYNPASPFYRHYLTPNEFAAQFGAADTDYQTVIEFFKTNGLTVSRTYPNRLIVDVTGSAGDLERVLHLTFNTYQHPTEKREFFAPDVDPSVDLAVPLLHISGLDNYSLPHPLVRRESWHSSGPRSPKDGTGPNATFIGSDFQNAYVPGTSLGGSGQIVGLLEYDGYYPTDIVAYAQQAKINPVPLENVYIDGFSGAPGSGNVEVALDIEVVMAMAPQLSKIVLYEANNGAPWVDLLSRMVLDTQVKQFSSSWGGGQNPDPSADQLFQQMAVQGQSFFQACGDNDAWTGDITFPSDNPYLTVVGGTMLTTSSSGAYASEEVWNRNDGTGTGGGISTFYPIPSWQQGVDMSANAGSTALRNVPDVALTAENVFVIADNGTPQPVGGTSAAAPLWAAFTALVNEQAGSGCGSSVGFLNPAIYAVGKGGGYTNLMHDIVKGNNFSPGSPSLFSAVPGFDLCTGWGTPTVNLISALAGQGSGLLALTIDPLPGSSLLSTDMQPVLVTVPGVTNATIQGFIPGTTNLLFSNAGQPPVTVTNGFIYGAYLPVPAALGSLPVSIVASAPGRPSVTNSFNYGIVVPPLNDKFGNATQVPVSGAVYLSNNRYATLEAGEPPPAGNTNAAGSLWWSWTPSSSGPVLITTSGSKVDNILAVYTGGNFISLKQVASSVSAIGQLNPAQVTFNAQAGQGYRITVASVNTNSLGSIRLAVIPGAQPNQTQPVVTVSGPQSGLTVTNQLVTVTGTALDSSPTSAGINKVVVSVNGCASGAASGTTNWSAPALLQPELNVITATAYDEEGNASAPVTIELVYFAINPVNDFFANAIPLTGSIGTNNFDNSNATKETGEPNHAGNVGGKSVWWSYTSSSDGVLTLSTAGSTFDTLLAIYTGSDVASLIPVASNDGAYPGAPAGDSLLNQAIHSNIVYHIAVDGYDGASGGGVLTYSFVPATLVHVTGNATGSGTVQVATVNSAGGSSIQPSSSVDVAANTQVVFTPVPNPGNVFNGWSGDVTTLTSPLSLTISSNVTVTANFIPIVYSDDFESGTLTHLGWLTLGDAPWFIESTNVAAGHYAARSGVIGNNQTSSLLLSTNFAAGQGAFNYRVSSELNFDFLSFFIDGSLVQHWSGEAGWATFNFPVPSGFHTLEWRYSKDPSGSSGMDAAFIDNVLLPIVLPTDSTTPARLSWIQGADGSIFLNVAGQVNQQYVIQTSTDLVHWQNLSSGAAQNGVLRISPGPLSTGAQFYRAVVP